VIVQSDAISYDRWLIVAGHEDLQIGCQRHTYRVWAAFSVEELCEMSLYSAEYWAKNKLALLALGVKK